MPADIYRNAHVLSPSRMLGCMRCGGNLGVTGEDLIEDAVDALDDVRVERFQVTHRKVGGEEKHLRFVYVFKNLGDRPLRVAPLIDMSHRVHHNMQVYGADGEHLVFLHSTACRKAFERYVNRHWRGARDTFERLAQEADYLPEKEVRDAFCSKRAVDTAFSTRYRDRDTPILDQISDVKDACAQIQDSMKGLLDLVLDGGGRDLRHVAAAVRNETTRDLSGRPALLYNGIEHTLRIIWVSDIRRNRYKPFVLLPEPLTQTEDLGAAQRGGQLARGLTGGGPARGEQVQAEDEGKTADPADGGARQGTVPPARDGPAPFAFVMQDVHDRIKSVAEAVDDGSPPPIEISTALYKAYVGWQDTAGRLYGILWKNPKEALFGRSAEALEFPPFSESESYHMLVEAAEGLELGDELVPDNFNGDRFLADNHGQLFRSSTNSSIHVYRLQEQISAYMEEVDQNNPDELHGTNGKKGRQLHWFLRPVTWVLVFTLLTIGGLVAQVRLSSWYADLFLIGSLAGLLSAIVRASLRPGRVHNDRMVLVSTYRETAARNLFLLTLLLLGVGLFSDSPLWAGAAGASLIALVVESMDRPFSRRLIATRIVLLGIAAILLAVGQLLVGSPLPAWAGEVVPWLEELVDASTGEV